MFCCVHDPALALFLSETPIVNEDDHAVEWAVLCAVVALTFVMLALLLP